MDSVYVPDPEPYRKCLELVRRGEPVVLATVVEAQGSTPQVAGASALVSTAGLVCGTVGGGRVEAAAIESSLKALKTGRSRLLAFDLAEDYSEEADAVCGGRMRVLIDASPSAHAQAFRSLSLAVGRRGRGILATYLQGAPLIVQRRWFPAATSREKDFEGPWRGLQACVRARLATVKPVLVKTSGGWLYLEPHRPAPRLIIAGAGHVGRAVAHQGKRLGFDVTVIDDRPELACRDRIPEADRFIIGPVNAVLKRLPLGPAAFVVIVTRGHRHDAEALRACIARPAAYIGLIGSSRKVGLMREDFIAKGWTTPGGWDRVHAPIGLPIGSKTVEEIAVSIAAEIIAVRRNIPIWSGAASGPQPQSGRG